MCVLMSTFGTLFQLPGPGNLLSALDRRLLAAVVLNRDMGPIARLPSLGGLPAAVLDVLPAPRTPLDVADVQHSVGLPVARMQHAQLCMAAAADGGMSMLMTVSLQHVQDAMQQQQMHAPQPAAQSSSNMPAASLALLHSVSRVWCWVGPTPQHCACTITERAQCSRSAPPTWRPCTLVH